MKKKWTLSGIARREFLNHRHWLLAICVNTIWLPPNWNIHTSEQMAPFALLPFLVPYTLSSCLWVCRHLMCGVMCERRCISWPWQCMQTFFTIHAKHRLPTPSERGEQEFHTVLFKLAAFSLKGALSGIHIGLSSPSNLHTALNLSIFVGFLLTGAAILWVR